MTGYSVLYSAPVTVCNCDGVALISSLVIIIIIISAPVQSVFVSGSNATFSSALTSSHDVTGSRDLNEEDDGKVGQLTFTAGVPSYLACVAVGGYPPPEVRVHLGQVGVMGEYNFLYSSSIHQ